MLKFENTASVGDTIRAYDFQPIPDRPNSSLIGRVLDKGKMVNDLGQYMCDGYKVLVSSSDSGSKSFDERRVGIEMIVPFEMSITDFDGRVEVL